MTDKIHAPWTPEQVDALNRFQQYGGMHPFTCGNDHGSMNVVLMAHQDGWHCSAPACDYRQDWAHAFMADPSAWPKGPFGERHGPTLDEAQRAAFPTVQGRCPACGTTSLFVADSGHVTCSLDVCPNPAAADELLHSDFVTESTNTLLARRAVASAAVYNGVLVRALHAEAELAALRQVARGYCPACGRGDAAPTVQDWEQQRKRADQAEELLSIAHDTSNKSEAARARAVERAERAEAERNHLAAAANPADVAVRAIQLMQETGRDRDAFSTGLREARTTNQRLNRRTQELESELAAYRRAVAQWEINERGTYIPHASLRAIGLASGKDILGSVRHLRHFERVEQAEAAIAHVRALAQRLNGELASDTDQAYARAILTALDQPTPGTTATEATGFVPFTPPHIPKTGNPADALVVEPYRNDRGENTWVFRCWGDTCDGWLSLDHYSQQSAERARDRHVAEEHQEQPHA